MVDIKNFGFEQNLNLLPESHYFRKAHDYLNNLASNNLIGEVIRFNGIPIHIDSRYKKIGVTFSGGADSTLLLYLLCFLIDRYKYDISIYAISVIRYYETNEWSDIGKKKIFEIIKNRFPNILKEQVWGFIPTELEFTPLSNIVFADKTKFELHYQQLDSPKADVLYFKEFSKCIAKRYSLDAMYDGTTVNPTTEKLSERPLFRDPKDFNNNINNDVNFDEVIPGEFKIISPFFFLEKSWVTAQYNNLNIVELYNMTHSCDSTQEGCGTCFHCLERKWAEENAHYYVKENNL